MKLRLDRRLFLKGSCGAALGGAATTFFGSTNTGTAAGPASRPDAGPQPTHKEQLNFLIAEAATSACEIVLPAAASELSRHAASRLQSVIAEVAGVKVPLVSEGQSSGRSGRILVGTFAENLTAAQFLREKRLVVRLEDHDTARLKRALLPQNLGDQGFVIYAGDYEARPTLALTAYTPLAVLYSIETLTDRIYKEGDRVVAGPLNSNLTPILNEPAFQYRSIATNFGPDWYAGGQWPKEWAKPDGSGYDWRGFVDWMVSHKINNLNAWLFDLAFGLAYKSTRFPKLVNQHHPNVKHEFMTDLIDYAHSRGIKVWAMMDFPDNWTAVIKQFPELAGTNENPKDIPSGPAWEHYQEFGELKLGEKGREGFREKYSWVCGSNPKVMEFWRSYLDDLLNHYPKLDAIGAQFAEDDKYVCNCKLCQGHHFAIFEKYFAAMVDVGRRHNPNMNFWIYDSWGTRDIIQHQDRYPNFVNIDWSGAMAPLARREYLPRSRWYLLHAGPQRFPDFTYKYGASILNERGQQCMQIRVVAYKSWDNAAQAFEEFSWNPRLTIDEYADFYIRSLYRRSDPQLAKLYAAWLKFGGYRKLAAGPGGSTFYEDPAREEDHARAAEAKALVAHLLQQTHDRSELVEAIRQHFTAMNHLTA